MTIGAIDNNTRQNVIGLLQFQAGIKRSGESIARLSYVYVHEKHRREGIALSLVNKMNEILQTPGISAQQFIPLCRLTPRLWNGLFSALQEKKIPISFNEMQRFDQNISGAVCDRAGRIKAFILCEVCDNAIRVDFADSIDGNDHISILSAIRELLIYIKNTSKKVFFLDFYAVGGAVMSLVNKI